MVSGLRIGVAGAAGRMGRTLVNACAAGTELVLGAAFEAPDHAAVGVDAGVIAGCGELGITVANSLEEVLDDIDVLIEFTRPEPTLAHLALCARAAKRAVVGTTGFDAAGRSAMEDIAGNMALVVAPNMSVGVNVCFKLIEMAARALGDDYDVEVIEAHHRHKVDAPSGTAVRMGEILAEALGRDLSQCAIYGREGHTGERDRTTIGFETIRGGDIVGEHTVMYAGTGERVEITHRAGSRENFAQGALRAAAWVAGRERGLYDMHDVLGLR